MKQISRSIRNLANDIAKHTKVTVSEVLKTINSVDNIGFIKMCHDVSSMTSKPE